MRSAPGRWRGSRPSRRRPALTTGFDSGGAAGAGLAPFEAAPDATDVIDCGGRVGRDFAPERQDENINVFEAAVAHVRTLREAGRAVVVAGWSDGSRERLSHVLPDHGLKSLELVSSYAQVKPP